MVKILKFILLIITVLFFLYILLPGPLFPAQLPGSIISGEPADVESPLRRAYYTDLTREEVMNYYVVQFNHAQLLNIILPTYRLNYPPEESQTIIRDQTRSTFLEEIVHPFRESIYINGFEPKQDKDRIIKDGKEWRQKIIVKYIPSAWYLRLIFGMLSLVTIFFLASEYRKTYKDIKSDIRKYKHGSN